MSLLLISGLSSNRCSKVLPLATCLELGTRKPICKQKKKKSSSMWPCIFELALSMILTGCRTWIHFQTKLTVATPQATRLYHSVHMQPDVFTPLICPSHNRNRSEPQERNPSWLVDANKLWEMKVCNLEERPSSNFKPKHPIIGLPLGRRGGCKRRANRLAYRGPFVYASVKVARFPQMWTWAFCKPGPKAKPLFCCQSKYNKGLWQALL